MKFLHCYNAKTFVASSSPLYTNYLIIIYCSAMFNTFPNKPWFSRVCCSSLLKTPWEKEKLLVTRNFSFSHSVFYPFGELSAIFIKSEIVICKFFQFGPVRNIVVWERIFRFYRSKCGVLCKTKTLSYL